MKCKQVGCSSFGQEQGDAKALPLFPSGYGEIVVLVRNDRKFGENRIAVRLPCMLPRHSEDEWSVNALGYLVCLG